MEDLVQLGLGHGETDCLVEGGAKAACRCDVLVPVPEVGSLDVADRFELNYQLHRDLGSMCAHISPRDKPDGPSCSS